MSKFFIYPPSPYLFILIILPPQAGEGRGGGQPGGKIRAAPGWGAKKAQPK